ncbi:MAG: pyridoxamine 5'-phosphate oxidase family protein [Clostridia bacterium]|nr:pyridoxamine 5'-phosphate oxidase family protein [Clostridia bacterium]
MNRVVEELKKVGIFYIATVDGDLPKVRPFSSIAEFEGRAYICTGNHKETYRQLSANPNIELSGMYDGGTWLRVSATVKEDERIEAQEAVLNDPTGPSQLYKAGDGRFVAYRLENVKAYKYNFYAAPEEIKEQ